MAKSGSEEERTIEKSIDTHVGDKDRCREVSRGIVDFTTQLFSVIRKKIRETTDHLQHCRSIQIL